MTDLTMVALLSGDLMFGSQLQAALAHRGVALANTADPDLLPESQVVFVDLNRHPEARLAAIAQLRDADASRTIVGFCHHGEKDIRRRGMEAGASHVIANRFLAEAAIRLTSAGDLTEPVADHD